MASLMIFVKRFHHTCADAIPSALGGLSALETLDLSRNQLSGESVRGFCVFVLACPYVVRNNRYFAKGSIKRSFFSRSDVVNSLALWFVWR